LELGRWQSG